MGTINKIFELINSKGMSVNSFAVDCKINTMLFSHWKKGRQKPSIDALIKIADYFNVSIDYLVGREIKNPNIQNVTTSDTDDDIKQFMKYWNQMDEFQKASIMGYAQGLINKDLTIKKQNKIS